MSADSIEHHSFIKTPRQLIAVVALSFVVPIVLIIFLTQLVTGGLRIGASNPELAPDAVRSRIQPIASVRLAGADGPKAAQSGEAVYKAVCFACHGTGALNSPKLGDTAAWGKLIAEGQARITTDAIKGVRQMPPRGGNPDLSDAEVARAVVYMANQAGAKWKEPADDTKEPAADPAAKPAPAPAKTGGASQSTATAAGA